MKIGEKQRQELTATKEMLSIGGRWYISLDALEQLEAAEEARDERKAEVARPASRPADSPKSS